MKSFGVLIVTALACGGTASHAEDSSAASAQTFALHGQTTVVEQASAAFRSWVGEAP